MIEDSHNSDYDTAFKMAIKALEHETIIGKIRANIELQEKWLMRAGYNAYNVDIAFSAIKATLNESEDDKHDGNC